MNICYNTMHSFNRKEIKLTNYKCQIFQSTFRLICKEISCHDLISQFRHNFFISSFHLMLEKPAWKFRHVMNRKDIFLVFRFEYHTHILKLKPRPKI